MVNGYKVVLNVKAEDTNYLIKWLGSIQNNTSLTIEVVSFKHTTVDIPFYHMGARPPKEDQNG